MPARTPAAVVAYNWSGIYTALSIGGGWRRSDGSFAAFSGTNFDTRGDNGWIAGAVGAQRQWGNVVLGIEGSWSTPLNSKFDSSASSLDRCTIFTTPDSQILCQTRLNSIWTVGGKVGYSFGNWMVYGTGGYASGRLQSRIEFSGPVLQAFLSDLKAWNSGWYAGAGVDVYVARLWWSDLIVGVEYKHIDLGSKTVTDPVIPLLTRSIDATVDIVMAKATFKWVGMGPFGTMR